MTCITRNINSDTQVCWQRKSDLAYSFRHEPGLPRSRSHPPEGHNDVGDASLRGLAILARLKPSISKKRVRFADEIGRKLERVHDILQESSNHHPQTGTSRSENHSSNNKVVGDGVCRYFLAIQPSTNFHVNIGDHFLAEEAMRTGVRLESYSIGKRGILCTVLVRNQAFEKAVSARYTWSEWRDFRDVPAQHMSWTPNLGTGRQPSYPGLDRFWFEVPYDVLIYYGRSISLELAVHYRVGHVDFWDNHGRMNYRWYWSLS